MKKTIVAALLVFAVSAPLLAKSRTRAFGPAHRANRSNTTKKSCNCETNYTTCMKNANANAQMQSMCGQMKQKCQGSGNCS